MDTTSTLAADLVPVLIKEKMLSLAEKDLVFFEIADKENLPEGQGKTIQFTRYERLPLPAAPVTEGITPVENPLTTSIVQAVVDQWVAVVVLTDVAVLTVRHPVLRVAQDRLGHQHDELVDREIQKVLMGTSNVFFPNSQPSRSALTANDVMNTDVVRKVAALLRVQGAMPFMEGKYIGVVDPFVEMDLTKDGTFINAASYSNVKALYVGEVGDWMGVRWKRSNFIPIVTNFATGANTWTASNATAAITNATLFTAGATVILQVTQLDPNTQFETAIGPQSSQTNASAFSATMTVNANAPTGNYNFYCTLVNGTVPTLQTQLFHTAGVATAVTFVMAATGALAAGNLVAQATGPVAPPAAPAGGNNVHISYVFGKEAFGVTELGGLQTFLTPPVPSDSDPAVQRRKASWKQIFKTVIKNTAFFERIETTSVFN